VELAAATSSKPTGGAKVNGCEPAGNRTERAR